MPTLDATPLPRAVPAPSEPARLAALDGFAVLDTPAEAGFDDVVALAAALCQVPIALVSLIDAGRQWFKAQVGLDVCETGRDQAFCAHAIRRPGLFVVPDTRADDRFKDNPLVTGHPHVRFYAGAPLVTPDGHALGTVCVLDRVPRDLTAAQTAGLEALARQAMAQLLLRRQVAELAAATRAARSAKDRFRAFMDNGPAVAFIKDADGRYVYVNAPMCHRFDRPEADWVGKSDADLWPADTAAAFRAADVAVLAGGATVKLMETVPETDGRDTHWQSYKFPIRDAAGREYLAGMALDMTADEQAAAAVMSSEAKFRRTVDALAEGVYLVDHATGRVVEANPAFLELLGYTAAELAALTPADFTAGDDPGAVRRQLAATAERVARDGHCRLGVRQYRRKDGTVVDVDVHVAFVDGGGAGLSSVVVRDVTAERAFHTQLLDYQRELEGANARLRDLATTDALTGTANRRAFQDRLGEDYAQSRRSGAGLSLLLIDVDHFKRFNDSFGHPAGDAVLRRVGALLRHAVRGTDLVARYGGEEFAVVLPDTDHAGAVVLADRVRRVIADAAWDHRAVTVSVGAATATADTPDGSALVSDADRALYRAKETGRNRFLHGSGLVGLAALNR